MKNKTLIMRKGGFSILSTCCLLSLFANPENGIVVDGSASFERVQPSELIIHAQDRAIIHWDSFSIQPQEITRFIQGSTDAAVLNRVTGDQMSQLLGSLVADGKVFLINPNGIIIGKEGVIDTASFIASSFDISNSAFISGEDFAVEGVSLSPLINEGTIRAKNGDIVLLASRIENSGTLSAPAGDVMIGAGQRILVGVQGKKSLYVDLSGGDMIEGNIEALRTFLVSSDHPYSLGVQNKERVDALKIEKEGAEFFLRSKRLTFSDPNPKTEPLLWTSIASSEDEIGKIQLAACPPTVIELLDPNPPASTVLSTFGDTMVPLPSGNVVVVKEDDNFSGMDSGAVYLYNASSGALLATLRGSQALDHVGTDGVIPLYNGNYLVLSSEWANGTETSAGAATWGSGEIGVSGFVSPANSLVGTISTDAVGGRAFPLHNGNYVVASPSWTNGTEAGAGAATWGNGATGIVGPVSSANSLVGTQAMDFVPSDVKELANGSYVVRSASWANGTETSAGAATWAGGATGIVGEVSPTNSLVGTQTGDLVGLAGIFPLTNGNYVVGSNQWANGPVATFPTCGAATFVDGTTGLPVGPVTDTNSLVGTQANDNVGANIATLTNGNFVVQSGGWANGVPPAFSNCGAATWANGTTGRDGNGFFGPVSTTNSIVGITADDHIGRNVLPLPNGHFVVWGGDWDNGVLVDAGAATWGNGTTGMDINASFGAVSTTNSLVGANGNDHVSQNFNFTVGVFILANGNYVVSSPNWINPSGAVGNAGAATWVDAATGLPVGSVSDTNSLVGNKKDSYVSSNGVVPLSNGNYVVASGSWRNLLINAGAATWIDGYTGLPTGVVGTSNSLVGEHAADFVAQGQNTFDIPGVKALANGNYVVESPNWANDTITTAGAATWGNGSTGVIGFPNAFNSLVGSQTGDQVSSEGVTPLSNGNYVVVSTNWQNGLASGAGAVTWGDGATGTTGWVTPANSFVGTQNSDAVGDSGILEISSASFAVLSAAWANGPNPSAGAVTIGDSATGTFCDGTYGPVSSLNSFVGPDTGAMTDSQLSNRVVVTSSSGSNEIVVQFLDYFESDSPSPGFQTRIFSIAGLPIPESSSFVLRIPASGIHDFAIAMTEAFTNEFHWLSLKDVLDASDIYPPLGTYKGLQLKLPSKLVEK